MNLNPPDALPANKNNADETMPPLRQSEQEQQEVEADLKNLRFKLRGSDLLGGATLALSIYVAVTLYQHNEATGVAIREFTTHMRDQTTAIREQTCLMRFVENERQRQAEFCKQIAR